MISTDLDREVLNATGTPMTVRYLRERVTLAEPNILLLCEVPDGTAETLGAIGTKIDELIKGLDRFGVVVDLADATGSSTAEYRKYVPDFFMKLNAKTGGALKEVGVIFYGNPLLRVVTKFFMGRLSGVTMTVHKNRQLALDAVRAAVR
jgi:hypothetical protein